MKKTILSAFAIVAILSGCGKKPASPAPAGNEASQKDPPPDYVVADVDGTTLTWSDMDARAMGYMSDDIKQKHLYIPTNRIDEAKKYFRQRAISAFVLKAVMLAEAARQNVQIDASDRREAYQALANALKSRNWTTNDFFNNGPLPPAKMRAEFEDGMMIDKLFKLKAGADLNVSAEESNAMVAQIQATNELKRASLENIRKQIAGGASFEELATKYSEDEKGKAKGGDIGEFPRGKLPKPVDEAAFSLPVGDISEVIHSDLGYHLIKVLGKMPAQPKTDTTPGVPETVHIAQIFIRQVPINRKRIMATILSGKYEAAKTAYYAKLREKSKISCFLYPDMVFH